jgi:HEAT repeat protein
MRLVRQAAEGSPLRRHRALQQLPPVSSPLALDLMAELLTRCPEDIEIDFLSRLGRAGQPRHAEALRQRLADGDVAVQVAALRALGHLGQPEDVARVIEVLHGARRADLRAAAVRALGLLGGSRVGEVLGTVLGDTSEDGDVHEAAAWASGACRCLSDPDPLRRLAADARAGAAGLAAIDTLGRLATADARRVLAEVAERPGEAPGPAGPVSWRLAALRALARAGEEGAGQRLARLLLDQGQRADASDVELVAEGGEPDGLLALLAHPHPALRARAADFLGRVVVSAEAGGRAGIALDEALVEERDPRAFREMVQARDALASLRKNESAVSP